MANGTEAPAYAPFVMFHMPWCDHCRRTIPELEEAAERVQRAAREGQLRQYPALPKFFTLSCDQEGANSICQEHAGKSYPSLIVFRDQRAIRFKRPRLANVISWWTFRVTRPAVLMMHSRDEYDGYGAHELIFLLHVQSEKDTSTLRAWEQIALDYLDQYTFFYTVSGSPLANSLSHTPSVYVKAPASMGLAPLPFNGPLERNSLRAWVNFNQFQPVIDLNPYTLGDVRRSGLTVVTLVHGPGASGKRAISSFQKKVAELRPSGKYLFAAVNTSDEDNQQLLSHQFPLLSPTVSTLPRIFAFASEGEQMRYWEDPALPSIDALTDGDIDALLSDVEAMQDESASAWMKEKRKIYMRFALRSWTTLTLAVAIPCVAVFLCWKCCQALCSSEMSDIDGKHDHVD